MDGPFLFNLLGLAPPDAFKLAPATAEEEGRVQAAFERFRENGVADAIVVKLFASSTHSCVEISAGSIGYDTFDKILRVAREFNLKISVNGSNIVGQVIVQVAPDVRFTPIDDIEKIPTMEEEPDA
jgi:hypothetical protein